MPFKDEKNRHKINTHNYVIVLCSYVPTHPTYFVLHMQT